MELEELLQAEGIAGEDLETTLSWARGRAAELASALSEDAELGPLLSGEGVSTPLPPLEAASPSPAPEARDPDAPQPVARGGTEPSLGPPAESAAALADELAAELAAQTAVEDEYAAAPSGDTSAALADLPPPPERPDLPEVGPGVEAGPMADAAYDPGSVASPLPEPPQEEPLPGVPSTTPAELQPAAEGAGAVEGPEDVTQPRELMPEGHQEAPGVTHSGSIEIDEDEIELLDDDDLELVDDDDDDQPSEAPSGGTQPGTPAPAPPPAGGNGHAENVPEWQAALTSAQLGGGAEADQESGLYRLQGTSVEKVGGQPAPTEEPAAAAPAAVDKPVEGDESMDVDLGDI